MSVRLASKEEVSRLGFKALLPSECRFTSLHLSHDL